ncbi:DUF4935 domain-containing protein [Candidatus Obscuribacterales bacterium]|nr:DUF4935 domain-containing protein [Candidatus Obscuribacterales bacterium]
MKSMFQGFYSSPVVDDEFASKCVVSFDTNVLLHLYRYSKETSDTFLRILQNKHLSSRLFLSHQVALEYHRHREQYQNIDRDYFDLSEIKTLKAIRDKWQARVHTYYDFPNASKILNGAIESLDGILRQPQTPAYRTQAESISNSLSEIFHGKVGEPYDESQLSEIFRLSEIRVACGKPPGLKDYSKESNKLGDIIIWLQLVDYMKSLDRSTLLFITDESKLDWWHLSAGSRISHPELVSELRLKAKADLAIMSAAEFVSSFVKRLDSTVNESSLSRTAAEIQSFDDVLSGERPLGLNAHNELYAFEKLGRILLEADLDYEQLPADEYLDGFIFAREGILNERRIFFAMKVAARSSLSSLTVNFSMTGLKRLYQRQKVDSILLLIYDPLNRELYWSKDFASFVIGPSHRAMLRVPRSQLLTPIALLELFEDI